MSKILIAGGTGFIGSHLTSYLTKNNHDVIVYDSNIQYFYPLTETNIKNMEYRHKTLLKDSLKIRGSVLDPCDLRRTILKHKPDYVINLAALPLAVTAIQNSEEAFESILVGTKNFMEILRDVDFVKKYIHISSSMVYGDFVKNPNPESAPKNPKEIYGSMKLASEFVVKGYAQRHDINYAIIRPSAVYGPTDNNRRVLQIFVESAIAGEKIVAKNPSSNILDFSFVEDTAKGIAQVALSESAQGKAYNITRGEGRSLKDVITILSQTFPNLDVDLVDEDSFYPKRGALDTTAANADASYQPLHSLENGLKKYIEFLRV